MPASSGPPGPTGAKTPATPSSRTPAERSAPLDWLPVNLDEALEQLVIRIYLAVVQTPSPTVSLLIAQGMDAQQVQRALRVLASRHLVVVFPDGAIEVASPDIALPAHAAELERQAREARASAYELAQMFFAARSGARPPTIDILALSTMDEIHAASAEIISAGRDRIRSFRAPSPRTAQIFAAPDHAQAQLSYGADGTELAAQSVFDNRVLDYPRALEVLELRASSGERARFASAIPFSAVVVDDTAAVIDLTNLDPSGMGSLLVRARPLVRALVGLADLLWDLGTPASLHMARSTEDRDAVILSLLAAGATDATIARRTGVSQRTVERRIAALMDQLGAGTRFQAGVQAARRQMI